jgi:shikimate kinase
MNLEPGTHYNIFLIGYRCTGKSSVGKLLSIKLGWPYIDTDSLLVSEKGKSIKEIVATRGWDGFRNFERDIVKQVCRHGRQVVATGGGVVLSDANVNLMQKSGKLIWLKALPETIEKRMMRDRDTEAFRPSLTAKDSFSEIEEILIERDPYYQRAMDFSVGTDGRQIVDICDTIIRQL